MVCPVPAQPAARGCSACVLGNPAFRTDQPVCALEVMVVRKPLVEAVAFSNWHRRPDDGGIDYLRARRVWATRLRPGDTVTMLHGQNGALAVHAMLRACGRRAVPLVWSARPHITVPIWIARRHAMEWRRRITASGASPDQAAAAGQFHQGAAAQPEAAWMRWLAVGDG